MLSNDRAELIEPFYLHMMGLNALAHGDELLPAIAERGRTLDPADVVELLSDQWRSAVMGAWFALLQDESEVIDAVLRALERSLGSLTSQPLGVAAVVRAGDNALPALI
jgi:hypothetical protein